MLSDGSHNDLACQPYTDKRILHLLEHDTINACLEKTPCRLRVNFARSERFDQLQGKRRVDALTTYRQICRSANPNEIIAKHQPQLWGNLHRRPSTRFLCNRFNVPLRIRCHRDTCPFLLSVVSLLARVLLKGGGQNPSELQRM